MASQNVERELVMEFLELARLELEDLGVESIAPPSSIRRLLLEKQLDVANRVVQKHNAKSLTTCPLTVERLQESLKDIPISDSVLMDLSEELNDRARLAYARILLSVACRRETEQPHDRTKLKASGRMERQDLLDLFALCQTAVRLPIVQEYVSCGRSLFPQWPTIIPEPSSPQQRLERVQHLFLAELGYDADFGAQEIKRIFFDETTSGHNEYTGDQKLLDELASTMTAMRQLIAKATAQGDVSEFSDVKSGGVTRVVGVDYSENVDDETPHGQTMTEQNEERQKRTLQIASQAAALQQDILNELWSMSAEERKRRLAHAKRVSDDVMLRAMQKPPGPERIEVLRSLDEASQRLMTMYKLWQTNATQAGSACISKSAPGND